MAASANIGDNHMLFEPVHGSSPKYAGQNKVNPIASISSVQLMFDSLGLRHDDEKATMCADVLERAISEHMSEGGLVTYDLGGKASTTEVGKAIRELYYESLATAIQKVGDENKAKLRPEVPTPAMVAIESSTDVSMACVAGLAPRDPSSVGDSDYGICFYDQAEFGGYSCAATGLDNDFAYNSLISEASPCRGDPQLHPRCPGLHVHHDSSVSGRDADGHLRSQHWGAGRKMNVHWDPALFEEDSFAMSSAARVAGLATRDHQHDDVHPLDYVPQTSQLYHTLASF